MSLATTPNAAGQELQIDYARPLENHRAKKINLLVAIDKFLSVKIRKSTEG